MRNSDYLGILLIFVLIVFAAYNEAKTEAAIAAASQTTVTSQPKEKSK